MTDFDWSYFTSLDKKEQFNTWFDNPLIIENTILLSIKEKFHLKEAFDVLWWRPIVEIEGDYYPNLVRQFYTNIEDKEDNSSRGIRTFVKGVHIEVTKEYIVDLLGVLINGQGS